MEIICTRPGCVKPRNFLGDLDSEAKIRTVPQRFCTSCGMPLLLADRYIPSKLLGRGGFGAAFLARDRYKPTMPRCVVKQFQPASNLEPEELEVAQNLFQREAIVLEELGQRHPQIPDLYAFFTPLVPNPQRTGQEQYFYLAQEFIDGQDLDQELETRGPFGEAEVTEILRSVLQILKFVHDNNTIHRDIKPSNIMRTKSGVLYLLDFGAVKQVAASNQKRSTGVYSMGFAPPEQMSGAQVYPATDIYALAVTCINLLTGQETKELYDSFTNSWKWRSFAPQVGDHLAGVLNVMLQASPANRFQSAQATLNALDTPAIKSPASSSTPAKNAPVKTNSAGMIAQQPPSAPVASPAANAPALQRQRRQFSLFEILGSAAFTGFEGALVYLALTNWLTLSGVSLGIIGGVMGALVFGLNRRLIEKVDLVILAVISTVVVMAWPLLQGSLAIPSILMIAAISAAACVAVTALFRLIYQLLLRLIS